MKRLRYAAAALMAAISIYAGATDFRLAVDSEECDRWVDSVMAAMTPRERIAQLFVPVVDPTKGEQTRALIKRYAGDNRVGGLLFRKGSAADYANMINYAQSVAQIPVMMTLDGEWGPAMRIPEAPRFPYNMALGAVGDYRLLEEYGAEVARQCHELGIHVDFAPVADVNLNPANPVIGRRSFGEDPERVARAVVAYSRGMEDAGVISCAKHFPGHGDTSTDSHKTLPVVDHSREFLEENDLLPFRRYFDNGLSAVMVGHLSVPALDATMKPASMSKAISTGLLKEEMGFRGLVFTDALEMKGAVQDENNCVAAFMAGADLLLSSANPPNDITAIEQAVKAGKISREEIDARCRKILSYKKALGLDKKPAKINLTGLKERLNTPEAQALIDRLTIASITVTGNRDRLLPLSTDRSIAVVNLGAPADNDFSEIVRRHARATTFSDADGALPDSRLARIAEHDIVIVGVYKDDATTAARLAKIAEQNGTVVPVLFTTPYKAMKFKDVLAKTPAMVMAYDNNASARRAAADAIFGGNAVEGRLPVSMPGVAELGEGSSYPATRLSFTRPATGVSSWLTDSIDAIMQPAVTAGAFPGAQVMVIKDGCVVVDRCYGKTSTAADAGKVTPATIYDLASLSKAVGTLPGIMLARQKGMIDLDAPIGRYIPALAGTDKASLTPRQLLFHESGMPASLDMYTLMMDPASYSGALIRRKRVAPHSIKIARNTYGNANARMRRDITATTRQGADSHEIARGIWTRECTYDTIMQRIYDIPLKTPTFRYSCLNFCLLMDIEQRVTGLPHQQWVAENIFRPIGAYSACYRPTEQGATSIAATETDNFLRKQTICGYVHDELAAFSGGVQGNAGLFASATDVAKYGQMLLNKGAYGGHQVLSGPTVAEFTTTVSPTCHRGLGFDRPRLDNPDKSSTCEEAPPSTYGHIGFTGTCCWIDPTNNLIYVFLSNRVNPSRDNSAWFKQKARSRVQSVIYKAL